MNNELTFTASTQGVPFKDYHWTINPRAALETGANAPLARPGGMLGLVFSLSVRLRDLEGNRQRNSILPLWRKPPQCSQDPCGDSSHSLRLNSDPPLAKRQNDPRPPLRRGPSHLPGIISSPRPKIAAFPTN